MAATYSPTWWGSTIGDGELNFSVRNGKRWILAAITATVYVLRKDNSMRLDSSPSVVTCQGLFLIIPYASLRMLPYIAKGKGTTTEEDVGLLVQVGFDIAAFRPPAYQRGSLPRPS